jgi:hypothetical protein
MFLPSADRSESATQGLAAVFAFSDSEVHRLPGRREGLDGCRLSLRGLARVRRVLAEQRRPVRTGVRDDG